MFIISIIILIVTLILSFASGRASKVKGSEVPPGTSKIILGVGLFLSLLMMFLSSKTIVSAGHVGVEQTFGVVNSTPLESGFHIINPLANVHEMNTQTQSYTMSATVGEGQVKGDDAIEVLTSDGLTLKLEITVQYRLLSSSAPLVFKTIGEDYVDKIVRPEIRSTLRDKAVNYVSNDLYSAKREDFIATVKMALEKEFKDRGIVLEGILLRDVALPPSVKESINQKISAQQDAQKMEFVLQKEKQEAERKRIEAAGIADFQKIVSEGISDKTLAWRGIQATEELAKSDNAKIVIIGNAKNGLPIILGQ